MCVCIYEDLFRCGIWISKCDANLRTTVVEDYLGIKMGFAAMDRDENTW
jgi:hypothetical protein